MPAKKKEAIWSQRAADEYLATLEYISEKWGESAADKFETIIRHQVEVAVETLEAWQVRGVSGKEIPHVRSLDAA